MSARLLVVESDPAERLVAAQVLQSDYEVTTTADETEARGMGDAPAADPVRERRFDLGLDGRLATQI
jgi:CheY-like chemotaxis protein